MDERDLKKFQRRLINLFLSPKKSTEIDRIIEQEHKQFVGFLDELSTTTGEAELLENLQHIKFPTLRILPSVLLPKKEEPLINKKFNSYNQTSGKNKISLYDNCPVLFIEKKKDVYSNILQKKLLNLEMCIVKNLIEHCNIDLELFSTKSLLKNAPQQHLEVRHQIKQRGNINFSFNSNEELIKDRWHCDSSRTMSTIEKYSSYQSCSLLEFLQMKRNRQKNSTTETESNNNSDESENVKWLKFGTNVDLSDGKTWGRQLDEIQKLPSFLRLFHESNLLSHLDHTVLGMNSLQLYMKVPGSRTPAHQENLNCCAVNVNAGPGDCEWFAIPFEFWPAICRMCNERKIDYLSGSWWPNVKELEEEKIPVVHFVQRPGDLVWINSGCVHWVQANGWCNNIAWNVAPFSFRQLFVSVERYEFNRNFNYKSIVPMIQLCWAAATDFFISDMQLYLMLKYILYVSLKHSLECLSIGRSANIPIKKQIREKGDPANFCLICESEVFNILFITKECHIVVQPNMKKKIPQLLDKNRYIVLCSSCVLFYVSIDKITILQEYSIESLKSIYDSFSMYQETESTSSKEMTTTQSSVQMSKDKLTNLFRFTNLPSGKVKSTVDDDLGESLKENESSPEEESSSRENRVATDSSDIRRIDEIIDYSDVSSATRSSSSSSCSSSSSSDASSSDSNESSSDSNDSTISSTLSSETDLLENDIIHESQGNSLKRRRSEDKSLKMVDTLDNHIS
ncbi:hypothetical protein SNEBB_001959 [Seison nebaliae]|nr:hypothetical protein SNEBB_001959 [Seison nebaliae]